MAKYVTATAAKNEFGSVLETALVEGMVIITRHDTPKAVLLSIEHFNALTAAKTDSLSALTSEFDALYARLQTPAAQRGLASAFAASPRRLARAAKKHG